MRVRSLRWVVLFGCAAIAFGVLGYSVVQGQAVEPIPAGELPAGADDPKFAPAGWSGSGTHPGKADFDMFCSACHGLNDQMKIGPGMAGLYDRVAKGPAHEGKAVQQRLLEFLKTTETGDESKYSSDPYFKSVQESVGGPGVQMQSRGGLPPNATDERYLAIIHYILTFRQIDFVEADYLVQVRLGRDLASGAKGFQWGGPSCGGCHTMGADHDLRGANVGGNIAHTYVLARQRGVNDKINYADGLQDILAGEDAPAAHYWYKEGEGSHPLTEAELLAVTTFFEQAARDTGTENTSNYLPIFALLAAALGILLLEPGVLNILFAKEGPEFIDGPYADEAHHHEEHNAEEAPAEKQAEAAPEAKPEDKASAEADKAEEKSDEVKSDDETKAEDKSSDADHDKADSSDSEDKQ